MQTLRLYLRLKRCNQQQLGSSCRHMGQDTGQAYRTLGLPETASKRDIKAAYIRLSKMHHPDRNPGCTKAPERYLAVREAYDSLSSIPESEQGPRGSRDNTGWWQTGSTQDTGGEQTIRNNQNNRTIDEWLKELERSSRLRKLGERMKQQPRQHPHYSFSRDQQEAYNKFQKDFVRRIDKILKNKDWWTYTAGSTWQERVRGRATNFRAWIFLLAVRFLLTLGSPAILAIIFILLGLDQYMDTRPDKVAASNVSVRPS